MKIDRKLLEWFTDETIASYRRNGGVNYLEEANDKLIGALGERIGWGISGAVDAIANMLCACDMPLSADVIIKALEALGVEVTE